MSMRVEVLGLAFKLLLQLSVSASLSHVTLSTLSLHMLQPGEGNGNPLQHSCLENPTDRGAWPATVHRVAESDTTEAT